MHESTGHDPEPDPAVTDSEHTSKETLSDLEHNEDNVVSGSSNPDSGPSPDGAVDDGDEFERRRADDSLGPRASRPH